jgi:beta-phosphoglucomutase-like phosphatase (HAD superfamily)
MRALIFDLDGTLIDSAHVLAWRESFAGRHAVPRLPSPLADIGSRCVGRAAVPVPYTIDG